MSSNDQRAEAEKAVVPGPPNGGTVVTPGVGAGAPAQGGTVVAPSQPGVQVPAGTAPLNQQQPPPQGPSNPGWQQPPKPQEPPQPGPSGPGWQQSSPGYGPPPTQPPPGGPGFGGPPPGGGSRAVLFIVLGVVAALMVGVVLVLVLTSGGDDEPEPVAAETAAAPETAPPTTEAPSPEPSPTEDGTGDEDLGAFPNQFEEALLSHLPEDFIDLCSRLELDLPQTTHAAITCTPNGADFIGYVQYNRSEPMNRDYNLSVSDHGVIKNSGSAGCQNGSPSEGTYTRGSKSPGRLMCYLDAGKAWMDWTHESLSIYSFASRSDGNLSKLFDFWINAGPFGRPIPIG